MVKGQKPGEGKKVALKCEYCGDAFERYASAVKRPGQGRFCGVPCQRKGTAPERKRFGPEHGLWKGGVEYRKKALEAYGATCRACGYDRYPSLLWVHHKDFKRDDHSLDNLEVLCIRCHLEVHLAVSEQSSREVDVSKSSRDGQALGCDDRPVKAPREEGRLSRTAPQEAHGSRRLPPSGSRAKGQAHLLEAR